MRSFLKAKYDSFKKRIKCASFGIYYLKDSGLQLPVVLKVNKQNIPLRFIDRKSSGFLYEFTEICLNDCYHLNILFKEIAVITTIIDIGANQGLFTLAARSKFPKATINCYEPNRQLQLVLDFNAQQLRSTVFYEAVTKESCKVLLEFGETDLHTQSKHSHDGNIPGTSLREAIKGAGGRIDILKLDCEGAEWELLEDTASWACIRAVTMEYHLWAKEGATHPGIKAILEALNFKVIVQDPLSATFGLIAAISLNEKIA
jgi:FkbM family methyltransferase